jgi:[protein-PII] uridylyltransferase
MWPVSEFFHAKYDEQHERHKKHNYTESNLEPNVKNAPGGLRDIQTINWVAKRFFVVQTLRQLEGKDFFHRTRVCRPAPRRSIFVESALRHP